MAGSRIRVELASPAYRISVEFASPIYLGLGIIQMIILLTIHV